MNESDKYLIFLVGKENFAMPLLKVREVIAMPDVTPIPQPPAHVVGIMNLRGQIITIFDLRTCLKAQTKSNDQATVVICEMSFGQMGLIVDTVSSVLSTEPDKIADVPAGSRASQHDFITNVYTKDSELILMLDVEKIIGKDVRASLSPSAKAA